MNIKYLYIVLALKEILEHHGQKMFSTTAQLGKRKEQLITLEYITNRFKIMSCLLYINFEVFSVRLVVNITFSVIISRKDI